MCRDDGGVRRLPLLGARDGPALMRTFMIGKPSDQLRRLHDGEIAASKPLSCRCQTWRNVWRRCCRFQHNHSEIRVRKGVAMRYHRNRMDGTTASPKLGEPTILKPNMTFHLMLGNWIDEDLGYVISVRVTETGVETFSTLPREIFVI